MNRWKLVRRLFEETVELDEPERSRRLREGAGGRDDVRRDVERLLAADGARAGRLDGNACELAGELAGEPDATALCGSAFGPYRIEALLSSGGMGHVYRAVRSNAGVTRRVAIKVLRHGLDAEGLIERFHRERRTLAALEHVNIVTFIDAGTLPDGRPYLAMELVEGETLTAWCRNQRLGPRPRLELMLDVLAAVHYAHQKLVVHRDLKPSNVLVTTGGVPKLLDFGVAAILDSGGEEEGAAGGRPPLTFGYASPEQMRGEPATTACDVFALGALLHEVITGRRAFPADSADALPPPRPPSTCLSADDLPARGAAWRRALRRDLDHVVLKALHPDPGRRYSSVDRMADDLRRHLARRPVAARPATWAYSLSRFAARNAWPLGLATALVAALLAGLVGSEIGRRRARQEASRGWGAHGQAKWVARFHEDTLVGEATRDAATRRHLIAGAERAVAKDLTDKPEAEALLRLGLARLHLAGGSPDAARAHLDRVLHLARTKACLGAADVRRARELLRGIE